MRHPSRQPASSVQISANSNSNLSCQPPLASFHIATFHSPVASMPPSRHSFEANPGSGFDDPFPREWTNYRYRLLSADAPRTPSSTHSLHNPFPRSVSEIFHKRDSAENIPHPPPPYTPTVALHAATLAPNVPDPSLDPANPDWPATQPTPIMSTDPFPHATNTGVVIAAVLISVVLALCAAAIITLVMKKKRIKLRIPVPSLLQRHSLKHKVKTTKHWKVLKLAPSVTPADLMEKERNADLLRRTTSLFQYVNITHDDDDDPIPEVKPLDDRRPVHSPTTDDASVILSPVRRHSSPSLASGSPGNEFGPMAATQRPHSLPPMEREAAFLIQRQKQAELAQMRRMQILGQESPSIGSASGGLSSPNDQPVKGLGIVNNDGVNGEVDIASTVLAALQHYKLSLGRSLPELPVNEIFQVDEQGKVVRNSVMVPSTSVSNEDSFDSMDNSTLSADSENDVIEIGIAKAKSVEVQKGVLVSLTPSAGDIPQLMISTPSTIASRRVSSSPQLTYSTSPSQDYLRPYSPTPLDTLSSSDALNITMEHFPTPPPMLSPILTSSVTLSAEIQKSLEDRVFAYRDSGPWSKANYKLTTPGQVRALGEALGLRRSQTYQQGTAWPWPAIRDAEQV